MIQFTVKGIVPPVFTAMNDDQTVNYEIIPEYVNYLVGNGIQSVLVGGTTGEHMCLSVSQRKLLIQAWVEAGKTAGLHVQVQVGGAPFVDVVDVVKFCASIGVDSLLTLPELYFKPQSVEELVSYVELVAKVAPRLPILYYHIPSFTKVDINMPAFVKLATECIPNFKGIKFSSNDLNECAQVRRNLRDDQKVFLGADMLLAPAALLGIDSSIGISYNLFPKLARDILKAVEDNDLCKAKNLQEKLTSLVEALICEGPWVPVMKAGMEIVSNLRMGPPALPQTPISAAARQRIDFKLSSILKGEQDKYLLCRNKS